MIQQAEYALPEPSMVALASLAGKIVPGWQVLVDPVVPGFDGLLCSFSTFDSDQ